MSDRIAVMQSGRVQQIGTPQEIYHRPATAFVARFIGRSNVLSLPVVAAGPDTVTVALPGGERSASPPPPTTACVRAGPPWSRYAPSTSA